MSVGVFDHAIAWTEEQFLSLGETSSRVELLDGSLLVSPAPIPEHQDISWELVAAFKPVANPVGLRVFQGINVRLKPGRITIPDLAVVEPIARKTAVHDVGCVRLICEIVSPGNPGADRLLKMGYYAEAGIPSYLLVEPDAPEGILLRLFRLTGEGYTAQATAAPGTALRFTEPFRLDLDPAVLAGDE